jgi:hypothetical protein
MILKGLMTTAKWTSIQECSRTHAILLQGLMKGVFAGVGCRCPNTPETHYAESGSSCDGTASHPNSVNTTDFRVSFLKKLSSLAVNFLHVCGGNISITAARNAWVGNFVCCCVKELHRAMDGGGMDCIEDKFM